MNSNPDTKRWSDAPPLIIKIIAWLFPVLYTYAAGLVSTPILYLANSLKLPIQGTLMIAVVLGFPTLIFVMAMRYRWFLLWLIPMIWFWGFTYHPLTGITQGALSACVSKAFDSDGKNMRGEKHNFP